MQISQKHIAYFENQEVIQYSLTSKNGFQVDILNYGGIINGIWVSDKEGNLDNVVLSYDNFADRLENIGYFGAIVGRHAGRIGKGEFSIDGVKYKLETNRSTNNLHGGSRGLDKRIWEVELLNDGIKLHYFSPHLEEGYPGNVHFEVSYQIIADNTLRINANALPDRKTLINLTNHTSFNLSGGKKHAGEHVLQINAEAFCVVDDTGLITGEIKSVQHTPFDFLKPKVINSEINQDYPQLKIVGGGYDHPFILNKDTDFVAKLVDEFSGRKLSVTSTEAALIFYSGNFLTPGGKINKHYYASKHFGVCLETQNIPNAINLPEYSNTSLYTATQPYISSTTWAFSV